MEQQHEGGGVSAIPRLTFSLHMLFGLYARGGVVHVNDRHVDRALVAQLRGGQPRCALRFATKLPAEGSQTEINRPTAVPTEWATHAGPHRCHGRKGAGGATLGVGETGLGTHLVSVGISLLCITRSLAAWQPGSLAAWQPGSLGARSLSIAAHIKALRLRYCECEAHGIPHAPVCGIGLTGASTSNRDCNIADRQPRCQQCCPTRCPLFEWCSDCP